MLESVGRVVSWIPVWLAIRSAIVSLQPVQGCSMQVGSSNCQLPGHCHMQSAVSSSTLPHPLPLQPTLNPGGGGFGTNDLCLSEKLSIKLYSYTRGSVVVLRSPTEPHRLLVKRLVGLEGDWVCAEPGSSKVELVPQGCCWVEGDNRGCSEDSRTAFGAVPLALLEGRITRVLWPPSRWGPVAAPFPAGRILALGDAPDDGGL